MLTKRLEKNPRWELHKNSVRYLEQFLETKSLKRAAMRPLTSHLKNHPTKTKKTYEALLENQGPTHNHLLHMDVPM